MRGDEHSPSFVSLVRSDLQRFAELKRVRLASPSGFLDVLLFPGVLAVLLFRLSGACYRSGLRPLSRLLYLLNVVLFGADLDPSVPIGPGMLVLHPVGLTIAMGSKVGRDVRLFGGVGLGEGLSLTGKRNGFPVVGDDCWLYNDAKVLGPVVIGDHAIVGANALVLDSVPVGGVVVGNPARLLRYREGFEPGPSASEAGSGDGARDGVSG